MQKQAQNDERRQKEKNERKQMTEERRVTKHCLRKVDLQLVYIHQQVEHSEKMHP